MKLGKLSLSAAALLACGIGLASAQSTTPPAASADQSKCWDAASRQIKDKTAANTPGSSASGGNAQGNSTTASGAKAPGSVTTGSGNAGSGATTGGLAGSATGRPQQAAGLPNC